MGLRVKFILFIIVMLFAPIAVSGGVFFGLFSNVVRDAEIHVNEMEEYFFKIEQDIYQHYSLIRDEELFFEEMKPYIEGKHLELEIVSLNGEMMFDSKKFSKTEEFEGLRNVLQQFNQYTVSIFQNNKKVAMVYIKATPQSPPAFTVNSSFYFAAIVSLLVGFLTFVGLVVALSLFITRSILSPLEKLDRAMQYVSEGDYSYELYVKPKNELGRLVVSFKEMREKLQASLEKQEAYEKSRKELIASISHDLRTPLASIQGYVEGLKDGVTENEQQRERYLSIIQEKSKQLNRLIEDLFEFSQVELDQLKMNLVPMNSEWLAEIFATVEYDCLQNNIQVEIGEVMPSVSLRVDPDRMVQVLTNLIQNAKRYINEETGKIVIQTSREDQWFIISVADNGSGIAASDLPHIFDRFYRGEKSRSRQYGGTGLGLAICKSIMEAHNGKITVTSSPDRGTTFHLHLPCQ